MTAATDRAVALAGALKLAQLGVRSFKRRLMVLTGALARDCPDVTPAERGRLIDQLVADERSQPSTERKTP